MGRMRLAYLIPLQTVAGDVAGALAVDVGWVGDLVTARDELRRQIIIAAVIMIALVVTFGILRMRKELKPLRELAKFADDLADETAPTTVPHNDRVDEIGILANGMKRVVTLQEKLSHLAYVDELMGLGNRSRYIRDLETYLLRSSADNRSSALLVDIAGEQSKVFRLTSDQFTILVNGAGSVAQIADISEKMVQRVREPLHLGEIEVALTASIGIAVIPDGFHDPDEAHRNAGLALSRAKENGGDQSVFFSTDMNETLQEALRLDRKLRKAIQNREIELYFQAQVRPSDNALMGMEALARWNDPVEGLISPGKFISHAEASGQIVDLGGPILDLACEQAAKWKRENFNFQHISVNVSP